MTTLLSESLLLYEPKIPVKLFHKYGIMTIKKDSILYSVYDENFENTIYFYDNQIIYCNFHPIESNILFEKIFHAQNMNVRFIKLHKDISLLFLVEEFINRSLHTALLHLPIKTYPELIELCKKENVDGWFSSVRSGSKGFYNCEIGLLNDTNIYSIIEDTKFKRDFKIYKIDEEIKKKDYGTLYKISFIENPIILHLHIRFKNLIEKYLIFEKESKYIESCTFQLLLKNAIITYYK